MLKAKYFNTIAVNARKIFAFFNYVYVDRKFPHFDRYT